MPEEINEVRLLLMAYYELLHDLLEDGRDFLTGRVEQLLSREIAEGRFGDFDDDKYSAYRDAGVAFVEERIETYNPFGIQFTFEKNRSPEAFELELQLSWYGGRAEFEALFSAVKKRAHSGMSEEELQSTAAVLVDEFGAYPNKSIITSYRAYPGLRKLPDYVAAMAIEEVIRRRPEH